MDNRYSTKLKNDLIICPDFSFSLPEADVSNKHVRCT